MKKLTFVVMVFLFSVVTAFAEETTVKAGESVIFRAMSDELNRSMTQLKMQNRAAPYYISHIIGDTRTVIIEANSGAIISSDEYGYKNLFINLRVGSYDLDNSNFVSDRDFGFMKMGERGSVPIEDDYDAIRYEIWLLTDNAYKTALEKMAKKKATLENRQITEKLADFTKCKATSCISEEVKLNVDKKQLESCAKNLSAIFHEFPKIQSARVVISSGVTTKYFVDSEGSKHRDNKPTTYVEVSANTQTTEGVPINDKIGFYGEKVSDLPDENTIKAKVKNFAAELSQKVGLKKDEEYSGPVLFEGEASALLFYQIVGKGVSNSRTLLFENDRLGKSFPREGGFLSGKLNQIILPVSFNIYDDPAMKEYKGKTLIGGYVVDDEGVPGEKITLVENGKLLTLPIGRAPTKDLKVSNGHGRSQGWEAPVGRVSNMIVESKDGQGNIKEKYIQLLKDRNLKYGIVITRLKGYGKEDSDGSTFYFGGEKKQESLLPNPVSAYRLYADGHSEIVKGMEFENLTYKLLKDIIIVGEENTAHNFIIRNQSGQSVCMSVISPSIVVDDLELNPSEGKSVKFPVVSQPVWK
ncbi:MAG: metallopeptidase TldD-related protein [bacterium]